MRSEEALTKNRKLEKELETLEQQRDLCINQNGTVSKLQKDLVTIEESNKQVDSKISQMQKALEAIENQYIEFGKLDEENGDLQG